WAGRCGGVRHRTAGARSGSEGCWEDRECPISGWRAPGLVRGVSAVGGAKVCGDPDAAGPLRWGGRRSSGGPHPERGMERAMVARIGTMLAMLWAGAAFCQTTVKVRLKPSVDAAIVEMPLEKYV